MKYALLDRGDRLSRELAEQFHTMAKERGLTRDDQAPDIVLSIGGDGTLLQAFHRYRDHVDSLAFVGVHTGHLGFYADWQKDELPELVELMAKMEPTTVSYPLLRVEIITDSGTNVYLALNEFTLKSVEGTLVAQLNINDEPFEMFRGDGIVVSTPTGSTGYNKSVNGSIIHPSLEALQIAEIASINNRVYRTLGSSIILPKHHHCDIVTAPEEPLAIGIDHLVMQFDEVRSIICTVADEKVRFARYRPFPFWNRVREAFIGFDQNDSSASWKRKK
ncbi:NAD kinase [Cohnella lubricantis]|uniref:NAD kinase n=1 Tax=Cohnella lubricantis TaxID=2163172 RepID=A0A841TDH0_9BACL|nr:NAD kinase [Cohnella lubricantis]MBB6678256.1 NAD kinase [Cohnella lubricantis]MBP2118457.1 NAD+ kinase [Cohnella lubricantis]